MRARMDALIAEGHGAQDAGVMAVDAVERSRNRASAAARS
jgi:hypothetical protein